MSLQDAPTYTLDMPSPDPDTIGGHSIPNLEKGKFVYYDGKLFRKDLREGISFDEAIAITFCVRTDCPKSSRQLQDILVLKNPNRSISIKIQAVQPETSSALLVEIHLETQEVERPLKLLKRSEVSGKEGQWSHVTIIIKNDLCKIYIDSKKRAQKSIKGYLPSVSTARILHYIPFRTDSLT
ncbi:hypothetical protein CPB86DRAFT_812651 [Serendipita vermifera]|nr:hypothetical protein CPB86DRAFT_812651 [Serendipita vermifera]